MPFKEAVRYLMENCFFTFGDRVYRQKIGIPMGSDPAPFMANLRIMKKIYICCALFWYVQILDNFS